MRWLKLAEYDSLLRAILVRHGLSTEGAARLIAARWPMHGLQIPGEAAGRGLIVEPADLTKWLCETVGPTWPDGNPVLAESAWLSAELCDEFLTWCVETGRARPTPLAEKWNDDPAPLDAKLQMAQWQSN